MSDLATLEQCLNDMAARLIKNATDATALDVFKTVSNWHIALRKQAKGDDDEPDSSFVTMRAKLRTTA
jgi:hypothetical protein